MAVILKSEATKDLLSQPEAHITAGPKNLITMLLDLTRNDNDHG